jgi:hypothetical protein
MVPPNCERADVRTNRRPAVKYHIYNYMSTKEKTLLTRSQQGLEKHGGTFSLR